MSHNRLSPLHLPTVSTLLVAVACSSSGSTGPAATPASAAEVSGAGSAVASEASASATSLLAGQAGAAGGATSGADARRVASARSTSRTGAGSHAAIAELCGVDSPTPVVDSDGDGVPDSVTVTYSLPACLFTGVRGADTLEVTGAVTLVDPTPTVAGFDVVSTATALRFAFLRAGNEYGETRSGSRSVSASGSGLGATNDMTTTFDSNAVTTGTLDNTASVAFTPAQGSTIAEDEPLPAGSFSMSGAVTWTAPARTDAFTVSTITPLVYDPTCAASSASPFQSGELRATIATPGLSGYARIIWSACAAPTILFVAR